MQTKTARLFVNGGSQAVRLPAEFRFEGVEVFVRRDDRTGDVILSKKTGWNTWNEYFQLRDATEPLPDEFMADRPLNTPFGIAICLAMSSERPFHARYRRRQLLDKRNKPSYRNPFE